MKNIFGLENESALTPALSPGRGGKYASVLILACAALMPALPARAQFNYFAEPRTIIITQPQVISATRSNDIIDIHGFEGVGTIDFLESTNSQSKPNTNEVWVSPDLTNWYAMSNFAISVPYNEIVSNFYYAGSTNLATNLILLPGTRTIPNASSAGFVTTWLNPAPFTNSGTFVMTNYEEIGFVIPDQMRYLQVDWIIGGQTNSVSAVFKGRKQNQ